MIKKLYIAAVVLTLAACTKEKLVIVDQPLTIDQESEESQNYLYERAFEYIKMYRFEKLPDIMGQISDQSILDSLNQSKDVYLTEAKESAFKLVTEDNETYYYKHRGTGTPEEITRLDMDFTAQWGHSHPNEKGTFSGFEYYPNLTTLWITNTRSTELIGFNQTPKLQEVKWTINPNVFEQWFPNEAFITPSPTIDFSGNDVLKKVTFTAAKITNIIFPDHELDWVRINSAAVSNDDLDRVKSSYFGLNECETESTNLVIKSTNVFQFEYQFGNIVSIDISASNIYWLAINGTGSFKTLVLNNKLERLQIANTNGEPREYLLEASKLPVSINQIHISPGAVDDADFSHLSNLTKLTFIGDGSLQFSTLKTPANIETFKGTDYNCNLIDLSDSTILTSITISENQGIEHLDLSNLNATAVISRLVIENNSKLMNIVLPANLLESQFSRSTYLNFIVKTGCQFQNKPAWLDTYITYY